MTFRACGWPLGFEQIGGMLVTRRGRYSARCSVCGSRTRPSVARQGAKCRAPSVMRPLPASVTGRLNSVLNDIQPVVDLVFTEDEDRSVVAPRLRRLVEKAADSGDLLYEMVVTVDFGSRSGSLVPVVFHFVVSAPSIASVKRRLLAAEVMMM